MLPEIFWHPRFSASPARLAQTQTPVPANASMSCSTQVFSGPAITPLPLAHSRICRLPRTGVGILADGFTGLGNLAPGEDMHYAFDVILQGASPVPEPASLGLIVEGALLVFLMSRKRIANPTKGKSI